MFVSTAAKLTYLKLVVEDQQDKPIAHVFPQIHNFLKEHAGGADSVEPVSDFDVSSLSYPESTATILLNFSTHEADIQMSAQELQFCRIRQHIKTINQTGNEACVLVHCAMGKSRSATAFIMYMMRRYQLSMDDAFEFCKS